jgi:hypothetical protein
VVPKASNRGIEMPEVKDLTMNDLEYLIEQKILEMLGTLGSGISERVSRSCAVALAHYSHLRQKSLCLDQLDRDTAKPEMGREAEERNAGGYASGCACVPFPRGRSTLGT